MYITNELQCRKLEKPLWNTTCLSPVSCAFWAISILSILASVLFSSVCASKSSTTMFFHQRCQAWTISYLSNLADLFSSVCESKSSNIMFFYQRCQAYVITDLSNLADLFSGVCASNFSNIMFFYQASAISYLSNLADLFSSVCSSKFGFNGTCYTASECTAKGGSARWPFHTFALDFVFVCVQCVFVYLLFVYLQICVFAVGHVRLLLASAVSSHSLVEAPLIRFLCNIRLKKNENMIKTKKV